MKYYYSPIQLSNVFPLLHKYKESMQFKEIFFIFQFAMSMSQHSSTDYDYEFYQIHIWFFIRFFLNSPTIAMEKNVFANPTEKIKYIKEKRKRENQIRQNGKRFPLHFNLSQFNCTVLIRKLNS